jgi:hypothetical protein
LPPALQTASRNNLIALPRWKEMPDSYGPGESRGFLSYGIDHFGHNKIRGVSSYTVTMQEHARPWLPSWAVVLVALCIPLVIAFGFLVVFDMANPPISGIGYESDPSIGQRIASRNDALIFLHAVAQGGFLLFGGAIAPNSNVISPDRWADFRIGLVDHIHWPTRRIVSPYGASRTPHFFPGPTPRALFLRRFAAFRLGFTPLSMHLEWFKNSGGAARLPGTSCFSVV